MSELNPHDRLAMRGIIYILLGVILLCYTFGLLQQSITVLMCLAAGALVAYGAFILKLHEKFSHIIGALRKK